MRTVAGADKIVVLKDGVVAEQGSPAELFAKNDIYARIRRLQSGISGVPSDKGIDEACAARQAG